MGSDPVKKTEMQKGIIIRIIRTNPFQIMEDLAGDYWDAVSLWQG